MNTPERENIIKLLNEEFADVPSRVKFFVTSVDDDVHCVKNQIAGSILDHFISNIRNKLDAFQNNYFECTLLVLQIYKIDGDCVSYGYKAYNHE